MRFEESSIYAGPETFEIRFDNKMITLVKFVLLKSITSG